MQLDPKKYGNGIPHQEEDDDEVEEKEFEVKLEPRQTRKSLRNQPNEVESSKKETINTQGCFTLSDIANSMNMQSEEKTVSRVLAELKKVHKNVAEKANRYGKKFLYTY